MATKPKADGAKTIQLMIPEIANVIKIEGEAGGDLEREEWLVAMSTGYSTEEDAGQCGETFRNALLLAGALTRLGVDCGFDKQTQFYSREILDGIRKSTGITPRVSFHGLDVYEDDSVSHIGIRMVGNSLIDPLQLQRSLSNYAQIEATLSERQKIAASLINDSFFIPDASAAFVVRITAVEALCEQKEMSKEQKSLIENLVGQIERSDASPDDQFVVRRALENLKAQGVRNAYMTKIRSLLGRAEAKEFDVLYGLRGNFVHDGRLRGQLGQSANEALELALKIIDADIRSIQINVPPQHCR
jgi:hypothetical protein